ncbi:MAG: SH3 domain-containing protein [Chloroflexota bacterium]
MSDFPDNPADDDYPDELPLDEPATPEEATPPSPSAAPPRGARRPLPTDELPPIYSRPALSRRQEVRPQPAQDRVKRTGTAPTPRVTPAAYPEASSARSKRGKEKPPRPARQPRDRAGNGLYLPWWSLVVMLAFVGCAAVGALLVVSTLEGNTGVGGQTPIVIVITSTFTVGPPASPTVLPQRATLTATAPLPTIPATLTLPPGNFAIGDTVLVVGVGDSGLNVRSAPGTDANVKFRARDGETYILKDGPQTASNDEWWLIQDQLDQNKGGWASRRFLTVQTGTVIPAATTP